MQEKNASQVLNNLLFWYMSAITLLLTLIPFRFVIPDEHIKVALWSNLQDALMNIALFIPLGFLFQLTRREKRNDWAFGALVFGLLFSSGIEITQLFIEKRCTTFLDVLTNGAGAWLGALGYAIVRRFFAGRQAANYRILAIDLPLMNIIYLMIPLMWINSMAIGRQQQRLWLIFLLGISGAIILGEIYRREIRKREPLLMLAFACTAMLWFAIGSMFSVAERTREILLMTTFVGCITLVTAMRQPLRQSANFRYEIATLRLILIFFVPYLLLVFFSPLAIPEAKWDFVFGISGIPNKPPNVSIFRLLEYLAGFSLLGYMLSQIVARYETSLFWKKFNLAVLIFWIPGILEIVRGFHPQYETSALGYAFAIAAGFAGSLIYRLQLGSIRRILIHRSQNLSESPTPEQSIP
ncbi:MAG: VanZ family protein [Calditrichaeota bacterium]|nr:VanZ family protein [Calditrichota bacterium]MCB0267091.1 VanZ family protein [Calditrichota bacterium]